MRSDDVCGAAVQCGVASRHPVVCVVIVRPRVHGGGWADPSCAQ